MFKKRALAPHNDPTSLGCLLIDYQLCTHEQLQEALAVKRRREDQLLGQVMVSMGIITQAVLERVLTRQQMLRFRTGSGAKKAVHFALTAARTTMELSGSLETLNNLAQQALDKMGSDEPK